MISTNVGTLKQKLSYYLRRVGEGHEVIVTSHSRQIARIIPEGQKSELEIQMPSLPVSELRKLKHPRKPIGGGKGVAFLLEDRARR